jgi:mandelamide amidase
LRAHLPGISLDQFNGPPVPNQERGLGQAPNLPVPEQAALLRAAARAYRELYSAHGVAAIGAPTVPVPPQIFTPGGPTDFETVEINGRMLDLGAVAIAQTIVAPRYGAPGLSLPVGLTAGLPVGLELDGLPGRDSELLGIGLAVEAVFGPLPPPPLPHLDSPGEEPA